ncbi:MAG: galactokinase [Parasphingorhabdus sp.]|uniref:galactokinase n=1 Tax=Parasphingorhabdus sp. TaxID=2709688 RepID=UPI00329804A9
MTRAKLIARARAGFVRAFDKEPEFFTYAPGRVNLIGEHTDYNDGFVLPMAINFGTVVAAGSTSNTEISAVAVDFSDSHDRIKLGTPITRREDLPWSHHVRGIANILQNSGQKLVGTNLAVSGDVPKGAGLSSSASLGVSLGKALTTIAELNEFSAVALARIAQQSEIEFVGTACGIMDQLTSASGQAGSALLLDCRSLETRAIALSENLSVLIVHSGVERGLADSSYNERREQCELAAQQMGVASLRDVDIDLLEASKNSLDETIYRRAKHVVTENARTLQAAKALTEGNLEQLGQLMAQSHISMRDDFAITVPKVDELVAIAQAEIGDQGGARMTGGGFGGCIVAVMDKDAVESVREAITAQYKTPKGEAPTTISVTPSDGLSLIAN